MFGIFSFDFGSVRQLSDAIGSNRIRYNFQFSLQFFKRDIFRYRINSSIIVHIVCIIYKFASPSK